VSRLAAVLAVLRQEAGPPGWRRPGPDAGQRRWDVGIGLLLVAGAVVSISLALGAGWVNDGPGRRFTASAAEAIAWGVAVTLPFTVRRRYPELVLVLVSIAFIGLQARAVPESFVSQIAMFLALYTVGAWSRDRTIARWLRGLVVVVMFGWLVLSLSTYPWEQYLKEHPSTGPLSAVVASAVFSGLVNVVYFGAAWAFGDVAYRAAGERALLEQRNDELARERDENARRAVLDERVRIARELHDVVAHHVSVMGVQAGAARLVLDSDPAAAKTALAGIEQAARQGVGEMRRLLGVLRDPAARPPGTPGTPDDGVPDHRPEEPAPGVEGLADLVATAAGAGLAAQFGVVGAPRPVPSSLSVSVYRIVQEALTNTLRHAGAARVDVRLRYLDEPAALEAEVVDDGRALARPAPTTERPGRGLGLAGMRERAALHDGELEIGPRTGGGWRVRARFPLPPDPAAVPVPAGAGTGEGSAP
jgi:signal transduction histidine kinase